MNIWLIQTGEPLPTDGKDVRLQRVGILTSLLVANGHDVTWWSSSFDHIKKQFRTNSDATLEINQQFRIKLLHSIGYYKNVSFKRILNHYGIANKFASIARKETPPDIILCSFPTIELSFEATKYGREVNLPVVLDVRDLWPDLFLDLLPMWARRIGRMSLWPMFSNTRSAFRQAYALTGITPNYVEWGAIKAKRDLSKLDRSFPFGYVDTSPELNAVCRAEDFWEKHGISKNDGWFNVCFFGTIGPLIDLKTVLACARLLEQQKHKIRFIVCGYADDMDGLKMKASHCQNVVFPGWVGRAEIWTLMRRSSIGLAPYKAVDNYYNNIPNKIIEYLSAGLPIVSCVKGLLHKLLSAHRCGFTYENANAHHLASILRHLSEEPQRLKAASGNALELYKREFVAEKVYGEMIDYLQEVVHSYQKQVQ